jgi:hypothetical protein
VIDPATGSVIASYTFSTTGPSLIEYGLQKVEISPSGRAGIVDDQLKVAPVIVRGTIPECFARGTSILMADGSEKAIEQVRVGDVVLAYDPTLGSGRDLVGRGVTRTFTNVTTELVVLRAADGSCERIEEVYVTPGHVFLRADGGFARIDDILESDGLLSGKTALFWKSQASGSFTQQRRRIASNRQPFLTTQSMAVRRLRPG